MTADPSESEQLPYAHALHAELSLRGFLLHHELIHLNYVLMAHYTD